MQNPPPEGVKVIKITPSQGGAPIPDDVETLFTNGQADTARSPKLVYPNDGVVIPPNLNRLEVHWLRGPTSNTLFEISIAAEGTDLRIYTRCEKPKGIQDDGCIWETTPEAWSFFAGRNAGGKPLTIKIRATDDKGSAVGASATRKMEVTAESINGAVYYWTTTKKSIMRYDFGSKMPRAEVAIDRSLTQLPTMPTDDKCVGCHTMSRDGRKIFTSAKGNAGGYLMYDYQKSKALVNNTKSTDEIVSFATFNPDGTQLAAVSNDADASKKRAITGIRLFNADCEKPTAAECELPSISLGGEVASHLEWSPDGKRIAFTHVDKEAVLNTHIPLHSTISFVEKTASGWGSLTTWLPRVDGKSRYNPSFGLDSSYIVFNESVCAPQANAGTCPNGMVYDAALSKCKFSWEGIDPATNMTRGYWDESCDGYSDPSAKLWMVAKGSTAPVELHRANAKGDLDKSDRLRSTFPRFAPFESKYRADGAEKVVWMTFSSSRAFGLRDPVKSANSGNNATWLWMIAVRPSELKQGKDPSMPAFVLPFQDLTTSNHIAVWTVKVYEAS